MAASAYSGSAFKVGSPLVTVGGVLELSGPALKKGFIDVTAISDTSEQIIADPLETHDEFTVVVAYTKADTQHTALLAAYTGGTTLAMQVAPNDTETLTFVGYVVGWEVTGAKHEASKRRITIKPTGTVTIA